jgi:molecular chaperone DnaK (HSP70)
MTIHCHDIHHNNCSTLIEASWSYCPQCGSRTGQLFLPTSPSLRFTPEHGGDAALPVKSKGTSPVVYDVSLRPTVPSAPEAELSLRDALGRSVQSVSAECKPSGLGRLNFHWKGQKLPPSDQPLLVPLEIHSDDAPPKDAFDTAPDNRRRVWDTVWLQVVSAAPPKLVIDTELLLFNSRLRERTLSLSNVGDTALMLRPIQPPIGYEIEPVSVLGQPVQGNTWTIPGHQQRSWTIRSLPSVRPGTFQVSIYSDNGNTLGSISLFCEDNKAVTSRTSYVIGVDFGTSGTSVWKRSGRDDRLPAAALHDINAAAGEDPLRFPTLIYVALKDGHETGFYIGYEALRAYENAGASHGFLVRELKSALRQDEEPYVRDYGPNYTIAILLRRFLQSLKKQIIDPAIEGGNGVSVAWNFSLPVLDSHRGSKGTLYQKQKSRLETAVYAAGYMESNCTLDFFTEPYCAAIYLLLEYGKYRYPDSRRPRENEWACIFDSGGGTTDVILGRIWFEKGQLRFEEVSTLGGHFANERSQEVTMFGGESVTRRTAIFLSVWRKRKYDYLKDARFAKLDSDTYDRLMAIADRAVHDDTILLGYENGVLSGDDLWVKKVELLRETDKFKRQVASLGTPSALTELRIPSATPGLEDRFISIEREEFDGIVVDPKLKLIGAEMNRSVFAMSGQTEKNDNIPSPVDVAWVFGVGGNCRTKRIDDWLQGFFPAGIQRLDQANADGSRDDSDRMLAVSGGAVWASKARRDNAVPYDLRVEHEGVKEVFQTSTYSALSDLSKEVHYNIDIPPGRRARFVVWARGKGTVNDNEEGFDGKVGAFEFYNPESGIDSEQMSINLVFGFERRRLVVNSDESGQKETKFTYAIG